MRGTLRSWVASTLLLVALAACADESTTTEPSAPSTPLTTAAASETSSEPRPTTTPTTSSTPAVQHHLWISFSIGGFPYETAGTWTDCVSLSDPSRGPDTTVKVTDGNGAIVGSSTFRSLNEGDLTDPDFGDAAQYARAVEPDQYADCVVVADFDVTDSAVYRIDYGGGPGMPYTNAQLDELGWYVQDGVG